MSFIDFLLILLIVFNLYPIFDYFWNYYIKEKMKNAYETKR